MRKKELALEVIRRLKETYPIAECTLDYDQAWKLLVSVRLAAQCTDARVNVVVEKLYEKYPDVNALADAEPEDIEAIVHPCGLGKSKARDISACMRILRDKYDGNFSYSFYHNFFGLSLLADIKNPLFLSMIPVAAEGTNRKNCDIMAATTTLSLCPGRVEKQIGAYL